MVFSLQCVFLVLNIITLLIAIGVNGEQLVGSVATSFSSCFTLVLFYGAYNVAAQASVQMFAQLLYDHHLVVMPNKRIKNIAVQ